MGVLVEYTGKVISKKILNYAVELLKNKDMKMMWCNAWEVEIGLYKNLDLYVVNEKFFVEGIEIYYKIQRKV